VDLWILPRVASTKSLPKWLKVNNKLNFKIYFQHFISFFTNSIFKVCRCLRIPFLARLWYPPPALSTKHHHRFTSAIENLILATWTRARIRKSWWKTLPIVKQNTHIQNTQSNKQKETPGSIVVRVTSSDKIQTNKLSEKNKNKHLILWQ
jgi:hypothetical protein